MPPICKVPGCEHSKLSKSMLLISHHFPANDDVRREWIRVIKNDTVTDDIPYDKIRKFVVCELHFHLSDYVIDTKSVLAPHLFKQKRCLKKTAVPSLLLPTDDIGIPSDSEDSSQNSKHLANLSPNDSASTTEPVPNFCEGDESSTITSTKMPSRCAIVNCSASQDRCRGLSFHRIKRVNNRPWQRQLINAVNRCDRWFNPAVASICSRHFNEECFIGRPTDNLTGKRKLKEGSLPTLHLPPPLTVKPSPRKAVEMEMYDDKICKKMCCVPGCDNDLLAISLGVPFHKLPNDAKLRSKWIQVIRNEYVSEDMPVNTLKKRYVCGKHFKPSDYVEDIKSKLAPHLYRHRPTLIKTAVPSIMMPEIEEDIYIESSKPEDLVAGLALFTPKPTRKQIQDRLSHLRRKGLKCEICGKYFNRRKDIHKHQGLQLLVNIFKCGHCLRSYDELCKLNTHIKRNHNSNQLYECNACLQMFMRATDIKTHVLEHTRVVQTYTCGVCGLNLCSNRLLSEHVYQHRVVIASSSSKNTLIIQPQQIEQPKKRLVSLLHGSFKPDLKIQDTYSHTCSTCHQIFPNNIQLQNHTLLMHSQEDTYECFYCKQVFSQSHNLEIHMKMHIGQQQIGIINSDQQSINGQKEGQYHSKRQREDLMETSSIEISDLNNRHPNPLISETNYICDVCCEIFPSSISLHVHRKVFHGERPHKCEVCGETFQLKISLDKHFEKKHSEKPYKCDVCLKLYRNVFAIENHRDRHVDALPLECYNCSQCFHNSDSFFRHVKAKH